MTFASDPSRAVEMGRGIRQGVAVVQLADDPFDAAVFSDTARR